MASSNLSLMIAVLALVFLTNSSFGYPTGERQIPLLQNHDTVVCDSVDVYTTEWFLQNTRPQYRREIHDKALFYTKGTSKQARQLACSTRDFVTLWDIWPSWLYDNEDVPSNKLRCIHNNRNLATIFYENMSRAYARMARKHATVMHSFSDYAKPPLDGIWGRVELPALGRSTDIYELLKINEDRSLLDVFQVPNKATQAVFERAIVEVQKLFRLARVNYMGKPSEEIIGSCSIWDAKSEDFLDSLF